MDTVLLAGPCPALLALLRSALRPQRIEAHLCGTEEDFAARCEKGRYRLIVTQFVHPFLNGTDLGSRIKSAERAPVRPAIWVLTPVQQEQLLLGLYENGVDRCLSLPVSLSRLCRQIEAQLTGAAL